MPNQDKTGPLGQGAMTGRGLGPCGNGIPRFQRAGRGFGRGFCFRAGYAPITLTKEEEKKMLEAEKQEIEKRLKELK
jgi:hypothetical protein